MEISWSPNGNWGYTDIRMPRNLHREETRDQIEVTLKEHLGETGLWPVVIGCPHGARELDSDTLIWFVEFRVGESGRETRWRDMPAHYHR